MAPRIVTPTFRGDAFTCLHPDCQTLAPMMWGQLGTNFPDRNYVNFLFFICRCTQCTKLSIWVSPDERAGSLVYPSSINAPYAHEHLPVDCRGDFEEAREISARSPRGAAALLRLCLQKLLGHIGGTGEHIDSDIKTLVAQGLDPHIQQALDVIRVTGNNAVHPLEMNLEDDHDSVFVLFEMINFIVEERISRPLKTQDRFANLPEKARLAIEKRDKPKV
ncbi:hypothetical protein AO239_10605 [Pseudomonas sp. ICMP 19500]|jgi:hypothetical protein|uniref:DUF4145 domain-containing protein n=1 Tax=Pseudomonas TaxID=286 RepID=UPI0007300C87|nr:MULTISPECIES: DUF4145 domain-containing protein [Pseudomonas]KTC26691.1 hypothetical protein AO239_10605 [Pseudomonas sp. ICMP 19500]